ncbi:Ig-like domain-containing protein [Porphyromonas sp.]|uniref:Ig-like domain-containing protein n=1 Tax=Porphyromonas sp. TaxID=1924944 RepID=UPI0026DB7CE6|nr:Ig-like domain-containing protein [Porphyromonas sp.]MDO4770418.1 Ig-like domain-containing protein [Porphyromonas sp.]
MKIKRPDSTSFVLIGTFVLTLGIIFGCANRITPGGGPYDETPPKLLKAVPVVRATNVKGQKFNLYFDEYIKVKDVSKKVIISPPQIQMPRITGIGKRVMIELMDTLIPNTTYTIDFTDAVVDNNEENPLENFSYAFSTGDVIDTMEISGHVMDARTHEPIQSVLVGIHPDTVDAKAFKDTTFLRMSRTSDRSFFVMRNIKNGRYKVFALKENDGNYRYDNPTDGIAFLDSAVVTTSMIAMRNDTIRKDSITIDTIIPVLYTRYLPDDLVLRYFVGKTERRFLKKRERKDSMMIELEFNDKIHKAPVVRPLGPDSLFARPDSVIGRCAVSDIYDNNKVSVYLLDKGWQKADSFLVSYYSVDSLNLPVLMTDSLSLRVPKPKKVDKPKEDKPKEKKKPKKSKKKGKEAEIEAPVAPADSIVPADSLALAGAGVEGEGALAPAKEKVPSPLTVTFTRSGKGGVVDSMFFKTSLPIDSTALRGIKLFSKKDSVLTEVPLTRVELLPGSVTKGYLEARIEYKKTYEVHFDSLLFVDMSGNHLDKTSVNEFKVKGANDFSQLELVVSGVTGAKVFELLDGKDNVIMSVPTATNSVVFRDLEAAKYGVRMFVDRNNNGQWDGGDYDLGLQPEEVYYFPKIIEVLKNWKMKENWAPKAVPLREQKPKELIQAKFEEKKRKDLNKRREEEMRNRRGGNGGFGGGFEGALGGLRQGLE